MTSFSFLFRDWIYSTGCIRGAFIQFSFTIMILLADPSKICRNLLAN